MAERVIAWTCIDCGRVVRSKDYPGSCTCGTWAWNAELEASTCVKCGKPTIGGAQPCSVCAIAAHVARVCDHGPEVALCAVLRREGKAGPVRLVGPFKSEGEAYGWVSRQKWYRPGVSAYDILPLDAPGDAEVQP